MKPTEAVLEAPAPISLKSLEIAALMEGSSRQGLDFLRLRIGNVPGSGAARLLEKFEKRVRAEEKEKKRLDKILFYEGEAAGKGFRIVAGVDEAGRGPLAGPVVAAAVILSPDSKLKGVNDSKKLSPEKREELDVVIRETALSVGLGLADAGEIDRLNIYKATQLAMERAVSRLSVRPDFLLTDAMPLPSLSAIPQKPLIHGDALSASIAAASIIAKVGRDRMMADLHLKYPDYGFDRHKGYGTEDHMRALEEKGICPEHRLTFAPVADVLSRNTPGGPYPYWKGRLERSESLREMIRVGQQIKRAAMDRLSERELRDLRELFRVKKSRWDAEGS